MGGRCRHLCADLFLNRSHIEKDSLAPELVPLKVPDDEGAHSHTLSCGRQAEEFTKVRSAPFILGYDAFFVRGQYLLHTDLEVGKAGPVFSISFGHFLRTNEGLGNRGNIVKTIGG